jgi:hypothetical protein
VAGRKSKAGLRAEHEHLVGLAISHARGRRGSEYGEVSSVWVEGVYPVVEVAFPDSGPTQLSVIRSRRPRDSARECIWLKPGEQYGDYRWVDIDRALNLQKPEPHRMQPKRLPTTSLVITVKARTWHRAGAKKKVALAQALAEEIALVIDGQLAGFPSDDVPADIEVESKVIRHDASDDFDLVVIVEAFGLDEVYGSELLENVKAIFAVTCESPGNSHEHWPTSVLELLRERRGLIPEHIFASSYVLEGYIGEAQVGPIRGRFVLR